MATLDLVTLVAYMLGVVALGMWVGRKQRSADDYFLGGRDLPWWAVCLSVIATETSTLTVIGVPAIALGGTMVFLQLTIGYIIGRFVVAVWLLPKFYAGEAKTAYQLLGDRFGDGMRATASLTFLITRLLADGVRLFATAIPLKIVMAAFGYDVPYFAIILALGVLTIVYTLVGGLKAVVWMDVIQAFVYVGGAAIALTILLGGEGLAPAVEAGKTQILSFGEFRLDDAYWFPIAVFGGAIVSIASHGTDQLIVQRLLACRNLRDAQKALIFSGFGVMAQFALFLVVGLGLWIHYGGASVAELGLSRGDEVFPKFIVEDMPPGLAGLMLAGIFAAAMSTLSSSLNALAGSTMFDIWERLGGAKLDERRQLLASRGLTLFWGLVFVVFASLFQDNDNPVVELGLAIASFTYGGLLGAFLLALWVKRAKQAVAIFTLLFTVAAMTLIINGVWFDGSGAAVFMPFPSSETKEAQGLSGLAWPLYVVLGSSISLAVGWLLTALTSPRAKS